MKVKYGKEFVNNKKYSGYKSHEGSKTKKVVGLFMAAVLAVSTGCYLTAPTRQDDQEDKDNQSYHSGGGGGGYSSYSSSKSGPVSEGVASSKGGIGSGSSGGGE